MIITHYLKNTEAFTVIISHHDCVFIFYIEGYKIKIKTRPNVVRPTLIILSSKPAYRLSAEVL